MNNKPTYHPDIMTEDEFQDWRHSTTIIDCDPYPPKIETFLLSGSIAFTPVQSFVLKTFKQEIADTLSGKNTFDVLRKKVTEHYRNQ